MHETAMMKSTTDILSEKIIEDILAADTTILAEVLNVSASDLSLIARQKKISSGKLDLLCLCNDELLLIELKAVGFYPEIINQINGYHSDLLELQKQNKVVGSTIKKIIVATSARQNDYKACERENIALLTYNPEDVLSKFYENFKELSHFLTIQAGDYGVVRLGLLNSTLQCLSNELSVEKISERENKSQKTIRNRMAVAMQLNLVAKFRNEYFLTDAGKRFNDLRESADNRLDSGQQEFLSAFVRENPFYSSMTFTILSLIETVFVLSKSTYPVPQDAVENYFVKSVGKITTWKTGKARQTATYIFSNYASELEFLVKINKQFYITPKGIQAILLLQLNRSIKIIESRK